MNKELQREMRKNGLLYAAIVAVAIVLGGALYWILASVFFEINNTEADVIGIIIIVMVISAILFIPFSYCVGKNHFLAREEAKKGEESRKIVDENILYEPVEIIPINPNTGKEISIWTSSMSFYAKLENALNPDEGTHLCVFSIRKKDGAEIGHETIPKEKFSRHFKLKF